MRCALSLIHIWVESRLVNVDRDLLMLPSLAIHMNRSVNDGYKYSVQKDMLPLLGDERAAGTFLDIVAGAAGVDKEDILGTDLFLYCRGRGDVYKRQFWCSLPTMTVCLRPMVRTTMHRA